MKHLHRLLVALHARGFHPAVLAGLIMMPAVVAMGFWTEEGGSTATLPDVSELRGALPDETRPMRPPGNEPVSTALPLE